MKELPPEDVVVMTNCGPARLHNGLWFLWDLKYGRSAIVAHQEQHEFTSWEPLVIEPWMKTTWSSNMASGPTLCAMNGVGLDGSPLPASTSSRAYMLSYTWSLLTLWFLRKIEWRTVLKALRDKPLAVCGRDGTYHVGSYDPNVSVVQ